MPTGCVAPNTSFAAFDVDCNVADPKRSPDYTVTIGTTYDIPLPAFGVTLQPTVTGRFIDDNVTGTRQLGANDPEATFNAGISLIEESIPIA